MILNRRQLFATLFAAPLVKLGIMQAPRLRVYSPMREAILSQAAMNRMITAQLECVRLMPMTPFITGQHKIGDTIQVRKPARFIS